MARACCAIMVGGCPRRSPSLATIGDGDPDACQRRRDGTGGCGCVDRPGRGAAGRALGAALDPGDGEERRGGDGRPDALGPVPHARPGGGDGGRPGCRPRGGRRPHDGRGRGWGRVADGRGAGGGIGAGPAVQLRERRRAGAEQARLQRFGLPRQGRGSERVQAVGLRVRPGGRPRGPDQGIARAAGLPGRAGAEPGVAQDVGRAAARRGSSRGPRVGGLPHDPRLDRRGNALRRGERSPGRGDPGRASGAAAGHEGEPATARDRGLFGRSRGRRDRACQVPVQQRRAGGGRRRRPGDRGRGARGRRDHGGVHGLGRRLPGAGPAPGPAVRGRGAGRGASIDCRQPDRCPGAGAS